MNIKSIRKIKGLTQKELAQKSHISFSMISKLESGEKKNPSFETLTKIASALDVSVNELLDPKEALSPFFPENHILSEAEEKELRQRYLELTTKKNLLKENIQFTKLQQEYISILEEMEEVATQIEHNKYLTLLTELKRKKEVIQGVKELIDN